MEKERLKKATNEKNMSKLNPPPPPLPDLTTVHVESAQGFEKKAFA